MDTRPRRRNSSHAPLTCSTFRPVADAQASKVVAIFALLLIVITHKYLIVLATNYSSPALSVRRLVNPTVYTVADFQRRFTRDSHFLRTVLGSPVLFVQGIRNGVEGLTEKPA